MTEKLDSETLVAFVDGELDASETRRVERLLEADAEARETVRQLRESTQLLQGAYQETLVAPIPARVYEGIDGAFAESRDRSAGAGAGLSAWPRVAAVAMAASLATFVLGYFLSEYRWEQRLEHQSATAEQERGAWLAALQQGLEQHVSGEPVEWRNPDSGAQGRVMPVRTFKSASGQWCREYEVRIDSTGGAQIERGIACRTEAGEWRRRIVLVADS